jgi:hypothetical protein
MIVDFFIVGEPKSGTTALANFLSQHPDVCVSNPKEANYFADDIRKESDTFHKSELHTFSRTMNDYKMHFSHCNGEIKGDASTNYLISKTAAINIKKHNPNAKIIAMFRNPVDYLYSLHMQFVNEAREDELDFSKALDLQEIRKKGKSLPKNTIAPSHYQYFDWIKYSQHLKRYKDNFVDDNIHVIITEEFQKDNQSSYREVLRFLNLKDFKPEFNTIHGSKTPRSIKLNKILNSPRFKKILKRSIGFNNYHLVRNKVTKIMMKPQNRPPIDEELRSKLFKLSKNEIMKLSEMIDRDLESVWNY